MSAVPKSQPCKFSLTSLTFSASLGHTLEDDDRLSSLSGHQHLDSTRSA